MRHLIRHVTHYRYTKPVNYTIQTLRLTPRPDGHQRALRWQIDAPGSLHEQIDAYGNVTHLMTLTRPHDEIELRVVGQVEVDALADGVLPADEDRLPVHAYCVNTALTRPDDAVMDFCRAALPRGLSEPGHAMALAEAICQAVKYEPGITDVTTAATEVLQMGHGVCQDHAHLFLACARGLGVPARYVSGYVYTADEHAASHAWADVWLHGRGWVSVDITNRQYASDCHCRLAVARDYDSASPVRGVRTGGGTESMAVKVQVQPSATQRAAQAAQQ